MSESGREQVGAQGAPGKKPTQWQRIYQGARVLALLWVFKVLGVAGLYGITRVIDVETETIDDSTRSVVATTNGGAFAKLRDGYTYYELAGPDTAPLVVLAAGSSVPGYIWKPTFDSLRAAGYRVLRYDYFGRGWSDRPKIPLTQEVYVHQLTQLLDAVGATAPVTLAGLSYGGTVITSFAAVHPNRVGALIYVAPAIRTPREVPWYLKFDLIGDLVYQYQARGWAEGQLTDFLEPSRFPDWAARYRVQMEYKGFRRGRLSDLKANAETDLRPVLAEVGKHARPVLVIWGRQDPTVPFARSESVLAALPAAKFVPVDSAGHLPQWERPAVTHAALFAFLRELPTRNGAHRAE